MRNEFNRPYYSQKQSEQIMQAQKSFDIESGSGLGSTDNLSVLRTNFSSNDREFLQGSLGGPRTIVRMEKIHGMLDLFKNVVEFYELSNQIKDFKVLFEIKQMLQPGEQVRVVIEHKVIPFSTRIGDVTVTPSNSASVRGEDTHFSGNYVIQGPPLEPKCTIASPYGDFEKAKVTFKKTVALDFNDRGEQTKTVSNRLRFDAP